MDDGSGQVCVSSSGNSSLGRARDVSGLRAGNTNTPSRVGHKIRAKNSMVKFSEVLRGNDVGIMGMGLSWGVGQPASGA